MTVSYFLGANSKNGFFSLYDGFPPENRVILHIIKGGPGTGKSSFMRSIGQCADARGLDVQYVLCSGDPQSLDGVYIPALREAWVDGTAPHAIEPRRFGVDGDYVNLGQFFGGFSKAECDYVNLLFDEYRAHYNIAYSLLHELESVGGMPPPDSLAVRHLSPDMLLDTLRASEMIKMPALPKRVFFSAVSCEGMLCLTDEIFKLCKPFYCLDGGQSALRQAVDTAESLGMQVLPCLSPVDPSQLEAIILPEYSVGFFAACESGDSVLLEAVIAELKQARLLHDELEKAYISRMDFPALTQYTVHTIEHLFQ